jgi:transposase InsO family protein
MRNDLRSYIASCDSCQRNKNLRHSPHGLLQPLPIPERPWTHLSLDFVVDLPLSGGNTNLMVVCDRFTKMSHFTALADITAPTVAHAFIRDIVRLHGVPLNLVSDRGTQFTSLFWTELCRTLGISLAIASTGHAQTDGQTERTNQTLEEYLRHYCNYLQDDWCRHLAIAEFAFNSAPSASSHRSPFMANYGHEPRVVFPDL